MVRFSETEKKFKARKDWMDAVEILSSRRRRPVLLRLFGGKSLEYLAGRFGLTRYRVRQLINGAIEQLGKL